MIGFWWLMVPALCAGPADTTPPSGKWIAPEPYAIIATDNIRVAVEADDGPGGSGMAKAVFFAVYSGPDHQPIREQIGQAVSPPYEIRWECGHVPDQQYRGLTLECRLEDRAGNGTTRLLSPLGWSVETWNRFVLDRHVHPSPEILHSWPARDTASFTNNDNRISSVASFDRNYLRLHISVLDHSLISRLDPKVEDVEGNWFDDHVEIFLDGGPARNEIPDLRDRQYVIAPAGMIYRVMRDTAGNTVKIMPPEVYCTVRLMGTLNREGDRDSGYTIDLRFRWDSLGYAGGLPDSLGLDIYNVDRDFSVGKWFEASWSNPVGTNLVNPSEWGRLVLVRRRWMLPVIFGILGFLALAAGFAAWRWRRSPAAIKPPLLKEEIEKARAIIDHRYTEENLNRDQVAQQIGLSPAYFGSLFKKEMGIGFIQYVTQVRVQKAETLLKTTKREISQIAFSVGFNSLISFNKAFKRTNRVSPSEFRAQNQESTNS